MNTSAAGAETLLRGKRILVVGRDYYFYTREIVAVLERTFGAVVAFHDIEPPRFIYRLLRKLGAPLTGWLRRYHAQVIAGARENSPDIVLFIQVHQIGDLVGAYRAAFGAARFVLYYWDSVKTHDYRAFIRYFDRALTFDRLDSTQVPGLGYLPLFFSERFRSLRQQHATVHDMSFVGVAVTDRRYDQLATLRDWARAHDISLFDYVVVSPILYFKLLLRGKLLRHVHFRALGEQALLRIYGDSRSVLDLPNNLQSGYTMRTFEALGAHRKLVTANRNIVNEDFYTPESVFVIGAQGEMPDRSFLAAAPKFSPAVDSYFLRTWIIRLLGTVVQ
jgi:hypothetical protein